MNPIILVLIMFFNVCINQAQIKEIVILEPTASPFSKRVEKHIELLAAEHFEQASSYDIQLVVNAILASYQCVTIDLKYDSLLSKLLSTLGKLKATHDEEDVAKFVRLSKKFIQVSKEKMAATAVWHAVTNYLEKPEQKNAAIIFEAIAQERVKILQEYLHNTKELLFNSCAQVQDYNQKAAQRIHGIANVFKAVYEMPYEGDPEEHAFAALNLAYSLVLALEKEHSKLMRALKPIQHHVEDVALINSMLDSLYYAECYGFLKRTQNGDDTKILFDQKGLIPEEKRGMPLPYVVYCNEDLHG